MSIARILIVEDQIIVARDEQYTLQDLGYSVVGMAATGEDAIKKAEVHQPDLVLMDVMLKGDMDGIEAARQIRERFDIPVIFVTAYADQVTLQRAKLTGPFGYILKPFEERDLRTNIEMALYKHSMDRRLKESEQWFSATLHSIGDAVIATDAEGRVKFMNPVAEMLTGWKQTEAVGQDLTQVFRTVDAATYMKDKVPSLYRPGTRMELTGTLLIPRAGAPIPIDDSGAPIKDERGNVTGLVLVFRDITERRRADHEREQLIDELDAFAHTVAHDLKNPLGIIVGSAEVLEQDFASLPETVLRKFLRAIAFKGRKMNNIVDELLLLAGARRANVQTEQLEMAAIVAESLERIGDMINEYGVEVHKPDVWPTVEGYGPWVEEVWINYLSNALKYGGRPEGGIAPTIELGFEVAADEEPGYVRFWVQDNGVGLSPEQQVQLFVPFVRLGQMHVEGHGLGLSIVQRIIENLGGHVGVESAVGEGSRFYFTLPVAPQTLTAL